MAIACPDRVSNSTSTQVRGVGTEAADIDAWDTSSIKINAFGVKPILA